MMEGGIEGWLAVVGLGAAGLLMVLILVDVSGNKYD